MALGWVTLTDKWVSRGHEKGGDELETLAHARVKGQRTEVAGKEPHCAIHSRVITGEKALPKKVAVADANWKAALDSNRQKQESAKQTEAVDLKSPSRRVEKQVHNSLSVISLTHSIGHCVTRRRSRGRKAGFRKLPRRQTMAYAGICRK
jgi:hypothetical protein